jgi:hypothetical protein
MQYHVLMAAAFIAAVGCKDRRPVAAELMAPPPLTTPSARAYVVQEPGGLVDRIALTIHVEAKGIPIAAYQGRLQFDVEAFEIIEATTPGDGTRLVNATTAGRGVVTFAGFSTTEFGNTAAVRLVVRPIKPVAAANLCATLDVVGEANGASLTKDKLVTTRGTYGAAALAK